MQEFEDCRKNKIINWQAEIITASIAMFLFKEGSRNAFNNDSNERKFKKNSEKVFKIPMQQHRDSFSKVQISPV
jgi:hypothetical protein